MAAQHNAEMEANLALSFCHLLMDSRQINRLPSPPAFRCAAVRGYRYSAILVKLAPGTAPVILPEIMCVLRDNGLGQVGICRQGNGPSLL